MRRWVLVIDGDDGGSIYACSLDCAKAAAEVHQGSLGECQGKDGVDASNTCDGGCDW